MTQWYVEYSKAITRCYVAYREVLLDTKFKKLHAMKVQINSLNSARNLNRIKKYFRVFIRALEAIDLWKKNEGRKSHETVSLNDRLGSIIGTPTLFKVLKLPVALQQFFKRGVSWCKMGSADLHKLAAHTTMYMYNGSTKGSLSTD
jgi:hypothetical protein